MKQLDFSDIRLIAVDLDGTLLTREKTVSPRTLQTLDACRARGVLLAFVTGRSETAARQYLEQLAPDAAVLAYGAQVMLRGQTISRRYMSPEVATRVMAGAQAATRIRCQFRNGQRFYTDEVEGCFLLDRSAPVSQPTEHIALWDFPEQAARALAKSAGCALSQVVDDRWCNFTARGTGKGPGMKRIMKALGLEKGQAIAFGDESCDVDFFRVCGIGVAMGNADEFTRTHADDHTLSNDCDGIAAYLERHLLAER